MTYQMESALQLVSTFKKIGQETTQDFKEKKSQSLLTQTKRREELLSMFSAIK